MFKAIGDNQVIVFSPSGELIVSEIRLLHIESPGGGLPFKLTPLTYPPLYSTQQDTREQAEHPI
jgi:hypothetical protein